MFIPFADVRLLTREREIST